MAYFVGIPLLAFLVILQSALLPYLRFIEGRPDLVLLAVVAWSLSGRWQESMVLGLIGGLMLDMLSGLPLGSSSVALILIAFLVSLFEERFWEAHLLMPLSVTLVASLVFHLMGLGTLLLMGRQVDVLYALPRVILPSTFLNLILVLPAVQLSIGLRDRLYPPEVEI